MSPGAHIGISAWITFEMSRQTTPFRSLTNMAARRLFANPEDEISPHIIRSSKRKPLEEWDRTIRQLESSALLYVGNLSFYSTEEQIHELFSRIGEVKRIIMGLNRNNKTPCGFCFVEYAVPAFLYSVSDPSVVLIETCVFQVFRASARDRCHALSVGNQAR